MQAGGTWFSYIDNDNKNYEYVHCRFPDSVLRQTDNIVERELLMVMISLKLWGKWLHSCKFIFRCDNMAAVSCINSGRSRDSYIQSCLREICFLAAVTGFKIKADFIPSLENRIPDVLSRWHSGSEGRREIKRLTSHLHPKHRMITDKFFEFENDW